LIFAKRKFVFDKLEKKEMKKKKKKKKKKKNSARHQPHIGALDFGAPPPSAADPISIASAARGSITGRTLRLVGGFTASERDCGVPAAPPPPPGCCCAAAAASPRCATPSAPSRLAADSPSLLLPSATAAPSSLGAGASDCLGEDPVSPPDDSPRSRRARISLSRSDSRDVSIWKPALRRKLKKKCAYLIK
jgi:hypothetical protein